MNSARNIMFVAMRRLYQGVGILSSVEEPSPVVTASFSTPEEVLATEDAAVEAAEDAAVEAAVEPQAVSPTAAVAMPIAFRKSLRAIFFIIGISSQICVRIFRRTISLTRSFARPAFVLSSLYLM